MPKGRHAAGSLFTRRPPRSKISILVCPDWASENLIAVPDENGLGAANPRAIVGGVDPAGTPFQKAVWSLLREIPLGETRTYGQLAARLRSSPRAVGSANGANPIALVIPCHRVIAADGSLCGYAYGLERKQWLLHHEATSSLAQVAAAPSR